MPCGIDVRGYERCSERARGSGVPIIAEVAFWKALGVSVEVLSCWLSGREALPAPIYLRALDLVATGR